jgi:hypothetical protein
MCSPLCASSARVNAPALGTLLPWLGVRREILADFLVRPLTTCRSLAVLWGNLAELHDEITRVRRSPDEKVRGLVVGVPLGSSWSM